MRRSIQINLDTGKKSVSRPIPSWLGHQRKTSIFVSLGVRDPSDSDSLRALDRCRGERRREHARHYGSLAPSSLGDYLCSSDQTWESKEKLRFLNFFLHFPWTLFMSLRPRLFVVSRRHPSRLLDHGNRPRGLRPEGNEEGGLLHWNKSYTKDSGVVRQKFDSARNSIVTSWPVVTSLCVKSPPRFLFLLSSSTDRSATRIPTNRCRASLPHPTSDLDSNAKTGFHALRLFIHLSS